MVPTGESVRDSIRVSRYVDGADFCLVFGQAPPCFTQTVLQDWVLGFVGVEYVHCNCVVTVNSNFVALELGGPQPDAYEDSPGFELVYVPV